MLQTKDEQGQSKLNQTEKSELGFTQHLCP